MRLSFVAVFLSAATLTAADDWQSWLNRGIEAYKSGGCQEVVEQLQKSGELNRNEGAPHLYLGTAWMHLFIPGAVSFGNFDPQHSAEVEFNRVLQLDPKNLTALQSLASLNYQEAQDIQNEQEKFRKLDETASWYQRVLSVDPRNREAYYSLGVIDWIKWYQNWSGARAQLRMAPGEPGPLNNPAVRQDLMARYSSVISGGMANLDKALEIDPRYSDAMAYMNLFVRERADLRDTPGEYQRDVEVADQWVQKALDAKKFKPSTEPRYAAPPPQARSLDIVIP